MTAAAEPRRPSGPRDPGDAWVEGERGRFWGRFGAAGLLALDPARGILLQHRVEWSDQGGTWGLPGGARHEHEDAVDAAAREAHEEAGVPRENLRALFTHVFDAGYWSYATVAALVVDPFEAVIADPESLELRWVALDDVDALPLHSGFAAAWPVLRAALERPNVVVVDAANVVGSRADGWWRDRVGAARRLLDALDAVSRAGVAASDLEVAGLVHVWPEFVVVLEGQAKGAAEPVLDRLDRPGVDRRGVDQRGADQRVRVALADGSGDDAIVEVAASTGWNAEVTVVTADRELRARVEAHGARTVGPSWFWDRAG